MSLHAYYCRLLESRTVGMSYDPPDPGETYTPCGIYIAETRGRAKAFFMADDPGVELDEFTAIRTNCVERHVDSVLDRFDGSFFHPARQGVMQDPSHDPPGETEVERLYYRCWARVHEIEDHGGAKCDCPELVWDERAQEWKEAA